MIIVNTNFIFAFNFLPTPSVVHIIVEDIAFAAAHAVGDGCFFAMVLSRTGTVVAIMPRCDVESMSPAVVIVAVTAYRALAVA